MLKFAERAAKERYFGSSKLFLLFTLIPIIELMILIDLGSSIGLAPTLGVVILTGALGAWAARTQGFYVVSRIQAEMAEGRLPGAEMVEARWCSWAACCS